jgi:multidrug efflux pump subunit AcrA (membrane-fusion protein)
MTERGPLDDILGLACAATGWPIAYILPADRPHRPRIILGLAEQEAPDMPMAGASIAAVVPLTVPDLTADPETSEHRSVTGAPFLRALAAVAIPGGLGALCLADTRPHALDADGEASLLRLARLAALALRPPEQPPVGRAVVDGGASRRVLVGGVALLALVTAGAGVLAWWKPGDLGLSGAPASGAVATLILHPRHIVSQVAVVGTIEAGSVVNVSAPFDGSVREKNFSYGARVNRGDPILRLDTAEAMTRMRDAQTAQIKARQHVEELRGWANGPDVSRTRRALTSLEMDAAELRIKLGQTKVLLDRGIVAVEEYRGLQQQQRSQVLQLQSAREDLDQALARGNADALRIAEFELANADARVADVEAEIARAVVVAPVSGVVLQPPDNGFGGRAPSVELGSRVTKGQSIMAIGDLEVLSVKSVLDEIDVNKVVVGDKVRVTGDALGGEPLSGVVATVAAQAGSDSGRNGLPNFPVMVRIADLTPAQQRTIRVGMSANLSIVSYENNNALVVPPSALHAAGGGEMHAHVQNDGKVREVAVVLGISTPDGIEVRDGLHAGDAVLVDAADAAAAHGGS